MTMLSEQDAKFGPTRIFLTARDNYKQSTNLSGSRCTDGVDSSTSWKGIQYYLPKCFNNLISL